jgi:hypothetical protein
LAWQFFWSQTGEEAPLAQIRGMVEWTGNLLRPQPINEALIPIDHNNLNPYGINTFLQKEVEPAKVEAQLKMIADAGFTWIRQEFPWEDIEIHGRGDYQDRRNVDAMGVVDAWAKYDRIVDLAAKYGIQIQARLSNPPNWSHAEPDPIGYSPPADVQDFVNFAVTTAKRYQGRITYYQIWNEPNIYPEWGALPDGSPRPVDPKAYTELLCRTYAALKAVDPEIVVISGALAPTSALWERDLNDFVYLQRMYDAGAGTCFDVLSMQGYGLNSGPTDRRMRPTTVNFGRNQYIRDLMVANGDAHKPIWMSEAAWNFVPSEADYPQEITGRYNFGQVTLEQAARYMPLAYQRAREEWAWVGVISYWFFTRPDNSERNTSQYYFRMVEPDYSADKPSFTPLPVYDAMKAHIANETPTLYPGVHQLDGHWAVEYAPDAEVVPVAGAQFGEAVRTTSLHFVMRGTELRLRWLGEGDVKVKVKGEGAAVTRWSAPEDTWQTATIYSTFLRETHTITLESALPVFYDSVTVIDRHAMNLYPLVAVGLILVILWVISLVRAH